MYPKPNSTSFSCVFQPQPPPEVLRQAADRGISAAFCTSAGYAEVASDGRRRQEDLAALAADLGILLAGPNGQGLISTPVDLCAQIVAPMPPAGSIGIASQSGGFVSTFANLARQSQVGISRAVSVGNSAQVGVVDFMEWFAADPATNVGLGYIEDIAPDTIERLAAVSQEMPIVVVRGGRSARGAGAVSVHTGSKAGNDSTDEALREAGVTVVATVTEAYRVAATFATQPLPKGPRTIVFGTAGGWGVVTADAVEASELELIDLPAELLAEIDKRVPPRWSRANPIDLAGGETRDTIPELLPIIAAHRQGRCSDLPGAPESSRILPLWSRPAASTPITAWSESSNITDAKTPASPKQPTQPAVPPTNRLSQPPSCRSPTWRTPAPLRCVQPGVSVTRRETKLQPPSTTCGVTPAEPATNPEPIMSDADTHIGLTLNESRMPRPPDPYRRRAPNVINELLEEIMRHQ